MSACYIPFCPVSHMLQHFFYITFVAFHCSKAGWANNYSWLPSSLWRNSFVSILLCPGMAGGVSVSEYACRLRLIVSQTQVDFKAEEYIDSAYIAYIQDRVLRQLYKKPKRWKSRK